MKRLFLGIVHSLPFALTTFTGRRTLAGGRRKLGSLFIAGTMLISGQRLLGGTWTALAHTPPESVNTMLLLSDGTVMAAGANVEAGWYRLTPDGTGSYVNGTWSVLAGVHDTPPDFS